MDKVALHLLYYFALVQLERLCVFLILLLFLCLSVSFFVNVGLFAVGGVLQLLDSQSSLPVHPLELADILLDGVALDLLGLALLILSSIRLQVDWQFVAYFGRRSILRSLCHKECASRYIAGYNILVGVIIKLAGDDTGCAFQGALAPRSILRPLERR